jgi:putative nucleotidyltransferase with HDIG domain
MATAAESVPELLNSLPALPTASARLLGLMGNANASLKEIADLIGSDGALTVEVLRLSNSAMFSSRSEIRSILQALAMLGCEKVKGIACTVALRSYLGNVLQIPALKRCWRHNLATAVIADEMAQWAMLDSGDAYTAGLLHDIGRIALIALDPAKYLRIVDHIAQTHAGALALETEAYGMNHAEIGAAMAEQWKLPRSIVHSIACHHAPATRLDAATLTAHACAAANVLNFAATDEAFNENALDELIALLPENKRAHLNLDFAEFQLLIGSRVNALES